MLKTLEERVTVRMLAWAFSAMFAGIVVFSHLAEDENGYVLGLFRNSLYADSIHLGSATWAAGSALWSERAARIYFRLFGAYYTSDAIAWFIIGLPRLDLWTNLAGNLPHFIIGPAALFIGFVVSRRVRSRDA